MIDAVKNTMMHIVEGRPEIVVINATNLGRFIDGIGVYVLNILREIARMQSNMRCVIYVNESCKDHLRDILFPPNCRVRWVSSRMSPDYGFKGHLIRLLYANWIAIRHRNALIFSASQLEAVFVPARNVIMIHDVIPLLFKKCHRKQYYYYRYLLGVALKLARVVITPSYHTKGLMEQMYPISPQKVRVIHNGVSAALPRSQPREGSPRPFILYTGRIVRMKNITGVLKAFALMKDIIPHKLVITGHGREKLRKEFELTRLAKYGIDEGRVEFRGHVSRNDMERLLDEASLLVFPSFYEGFGLPPLEAMAHGCPAVVSHVASLPEICGEAAYYVDPYDIPSIARGMYAVLTDHELRGQLIARGFARAKLYDWSRSAADHVDVFRRVLRARDVEVKTTGLHEAYGGVAARQRIIAAESPINFIS